MVEIILIFVIAKKIAAMMKEKNRAPAGYVVLFVVFWVVGEVLGAIVGVVATIAANPNGVDDPFPLLVFAGAILGAAIGGCIGYAFAASVPALEGVDRARLDDYDDEEDDVEDYRDRERERGRSPRDEGRFEEGERRRRGRGDGSFEERGDR